MLAQRLAEALRGSALSEPARPAARTAASSAVQQVPPLAPERAPCVPFLARLLKTSARATTAPGLAAAGGKRARGDEGDLVRQLLATRTAAHELRSSRAAIAQTGAGEAFSSLPTVEAAGAAVLAMARGMDLSEPRLSALRQYALFCSTKGSAPLFPITHVRVAAYAGWYVLSKMNMSSSLPGAVSNLRVAAKAEGLWDVDAEGEEHVAKAISALQRVAPAQQRESAGADLDGLVRVLGMLASSAAAVDTLVGCAIACAVGFKMRNTEISGNKLGSRGVCRGDVRVEPAGAVWGAVSVKVEQTSLMPRPRAAPHMPLRYSMLCVAAWLQRLWACIDPEGTQPDDAPLFPKLGQDGRWTAQPREPGELLERMFAAMKAGGVDTSLLSAEWGRHTGEDLHITKCGMPGSVSDFLGDHAQCSTVSRRHYLHVTGRGKDILEVGYTHVVNYARATCCLAEPLMIEPNGVA